MSVDEMQQKDILHLSENLERLEKSMDKGFAKLEAKIEILTDNYITRTVLKEELEKKADKWVESVLSRIGYAVILILVGSVLGLILINPSL